VERVASPCVSLHFQSPYFTGPVFSLIVLYHIRIAFWRCAVSFFGMRDGRGLGAAEEGCLEQDGQDWGRGRAPEKTSPSLCASAGSFLGMWDG
jgi:hypothetical protein